MEILGDASKARFIAAFIDNFVALLLMYSIVVVVPETLPLVKGIVIVGVYLGYFFLLEGIWARTIGKYFQGLLVRQLDGSKCNWQAAFIRSLTRILEVNPALFGGIPAGLLIVSSERKQRLGDMLAGTVVVSDKLMWALDDSCNAEIERPE
jgi:uncharacterized RDD family membrane protein YckC